MQPATKQAALCALFARFAARVTAHAVGFDFVPFAFVATDADRTFFDCHDKHLMRVEQ
jgi:hypothetical protein